MSENPEDEGNDDLWGVSKPVRFPTWDPGSDSRISDQCLSILAFAKQHEQQHFQKSLETVYYSEHRRGSPIIESSPQGRGLDLFFGLPPKVPTRPPPIFLKGFADPPEHAPRVEIQDAGPSPPFVPVDLEDDLWEGLGGG